MIKHWIIVTFALLLGGASPAMAGSVSSATGTLCTSYSSMAVDPAGNVSITGCNLGSTNASFTVVAAAATATTGTPLVVTVTRTLSTGGTPGLDTLTLTSSLAGGTFTPATLNFTAADGATSSKSSSITFTAVGTAILSATGATTVTASSPITVTLGSTGSCAGITPYPIKNNRPVPELIPIGSYGFGAVKLVDMINNYGVGALAFKVSTDTPVSGYWVGQYTDYTGAAVGPVYAAISECSGDMRGAGDPSANVSATDKLCRTDPADTFLGVVFSNAATTPYCKLVAGKTYYYNMRGSILGAPTGMLVNFNAQ